MSKLVGLSLVPKKLFPKAIYFHQNRFIPDYIIQMVPVFTEWLGLG